MTDSIHWNDCRIEKTDQPERKGNIQARMYQLSQFEWVTPLPTAVTPEPLKKTALKEFFISTCDNRF